ncbi:hypothetical protein [Pedobacter glucosidilyticus]|uniref:hypothetical protein n=1 Tax=Pedobacter glucosidilyticus TaxID=1122941 RepID=UPI0026E987F9|nr:hypothetical protein [Pedobacter glucosidilyticus]
MMKNNQTEDILNSINQNVFFKEFTFSKNDFIIQNNKLEFSDHLVWLDDIYFIFEVKDRHPNEKGDDQKWFKKKVLDKAVGQIKNTIQYIKDYPEITLKNNKGHQLNVSQVEIQHIKKVIIYTPGIDFPEQKRQIKFYNSRSAGLIHLFHSEDYYWVCKYLITPSEVKEYLDFREDFYEAQSKVLDLFPEQYVLAHFLETLEVDHIEPRYIENLKIIDKELPDFDMAGIIKNFTTQLTLTNGETEYYAIIKEIAKLQRTDLIEFKKRFIKATEVCKKDNLVTPYRIYVPRTDCGFIFIPLPKSKSANWRTAITNYTLAHKYDQKALKCVGIVVIDLIIEAETYFNCYWMYVESPWNYEEEIEKKLAENFPFRKMNMKKIDNRYKI